MIVIKLLSVLVFAYAVLISGVSTVVSKHQVGTVTFINNAADIALTAVVVDNTFDYDISPQTSPILPNSVITTNFHYRIAHFTGCQISHTCIRAPPLIA